MCLYVTNLPLLPWITLSRVTTLFILYHNFSFFSYFSLFLVTLNSNFILLIYFYHLKKKKNNNFSTQEMFKKEPNIEIVLNETLNKALSNTHAPRKICLSLINLETWKKRIEETCMQNWRSLIIIFNISIGEKAREGKERKSSINPNPSCCMCKAFGVHSTLLSPSYQLLL